MPRHSGASGVALSTLVALAFCTSVSPRAAEKQDAQDFTQIERGRYLTTAADCAACHTMPDQKQPFAGGRPIETPFGVIVAPNITPDRETGIGTWTDDEFDAALRQGKRPDGSRLYPAMPYPAYTKMSREDVQDIRAYLATIAPVHNQVEPNQLPFPFSVRAAMMAWDALYFQEGEFRPDATKSATWNRGAYLVQGPGHCASCHTPKTVLGGDKTEQAFQGGVIQGWFAPDLTNDKATGLGSWSAEDIVAYLGTGHNASTAATGLMAEVVERSTSKMTKADLEAIAAYLKDQPAAGHTATAVQATDPLMVAGGAIYHDVCSACHAIDGTGVPHLIPSLAASPSVHSTDPTTLVRVTLSGARSVATDQEPTAPAMPAFAWQFNDEQIAAVLTYVRNSWGSAAPAVTAHDVETKRVELKTRGEH
ncbi:c-type cytochrome [Microvirga puerhi]|uniref:Cytochrome c n=1 Tax=Microvirga puerhi TaxID=2876078 RepID=A0ABS7VJJ9_9HYPH|nr:cytochrome c [Microvirga puerhi]MBZ6075696.1 cytochrome c [Microvirga puerhi]